MGKNTERLVQRVFESMRDNYLQKKMDRAAVKLQTKARGLLGRNTMQRRRELEVKVKEMAYLVAGKNVERLQKKFIHLMFQGLQEKAAVKFQCILRGKRGREELAFRKERERRVKALCRRCLGDTGRLGFLAFREYLAVAREEKGKAATKLQTRFRMRRAKARLEWERKEKIRKEELIAMALGRNTER